MSSSAPTPLVVSVGDLIEEIAVRLSAPWRPGSDAAAAITTRRGGSAANVAVAVAAAGLAAAVSLGEFGAASFLARAGTPTVPLQIARARQPPGEWHCLGVTITRDRVDEIARTLHSGAASDVQPSTEKN